MIQNHQFTWCGIITVPHQSQQEVKGTEKDVTSRKPKKSDMTSNSALKKSDCEIRI